MRRYYPCPCSPWTDDGFAEAGMERRVVVAPHSLYLLLLVLLLLLLLLLLLSLLLLLLLLSLLLLLIPQ